MLVGRAALVTGGTDGIGLGIASRFAQAGGSIPLTDFDTERGQPAADTLKQAGGTAKFIPCDHLPGGNVGLVPHVRVATAGYGKGNGGL